MDDENVIQRLQTALRSADVAAVAELLPRVPLAVPMDGNVPKIAVDGETRLLPVFLSMDSWRAFGLPGDPRLLPAQALGHLLAELPDVEAVMFDPALPTAVRIPSADVIELTRPRS